LTPINYFREIKFMSLDLQINYFTGLHLPPIVFYLFFVTSYLFVGNKFVVSFCFYGISVVICVFDK